MAFISRFVITEQANKNTPTIILKSVNLSNPELKLLNSKPKRKP